MFEVCIGGGEDERRGKRREGVKVKVKVAVYSEGSWNPGFVI